MLIAKLNKYKKSLKLVNEPNKGINIKNKLIILKIPYIKEAIAKIIPTIIKHFKYFFSLFLFSKTKKIK